VPQDYDEKRFAQIENIPGEGGDEADNFEPSGEERQTSSCPRKMSPRPTTLPPSGPRADARLAAVTAAPRW
jgi:hypothetical protein